MPADFVLRRDACSYGYFLLVPSRWDPAAGVVSRSLDLLGRGVCARLSQTPAQPGAGLTARFDAALSAAERAEAKRQIGRMLRLDETAGEIAAFHAVDPRWAATGRGRLSRSPTLFEDVIKTVTSCNVAWTSTIRMNERLCAVLGRPTATGEPTFPTPEKLARTRAGTLRGRCRVGYRDGRMIELARLFARGEIEEGWLTDRGRSDAEVFRFLKGLPGIGPYAAGNIMQLLGRYSFLALDSESVRHGRVVLGLEGTEREILSKVAAHFEPFGEHKFRSYWFELWSYYEAKRGPSWTWERETTGKTFTASMLRE